MAPFTPHHKQNLPGKNQVTLVLIYLFHGQAQERSPKWEGALQPYGVNKDAQELIPPSLSCPKTRYPWGLFSSQSRESI